MIADDLEIPEQCLEYNPTWWIPNNPTVLSDFSLLVFRLFWMYSCLICSEFEKLSMSLCFSHCVVHVQWLVVVDEKSAGRMFDEVLVVALGLRLRGHTNLSDAKVQYGWVAELITAILSVSMVWNWTLGCSVKSLFCTNDWLWESCLDFTRGKSDREGEVISRAGKNLVFSYLITHFGKPTLPSAPEIIFQDHKIDLQEWKSGLSCQLISNRKYQYIKPPAFASRGTNISDTLTLDLLQSKCTILMILVQIIPFLTETWLQEGFLVSFSKLNEFD